MIGAIHLALLEFQVFAILEGAVIGDMCADEHWHDHIIHANFHTCFRRSIHRHDAGTGRDVGRLLDRDEITSRCAVRLHLNLNQSGYGFLGLDYLGAKFTREINDRTQVL